MIIDSSVAAAILGDEPNAGRLARAISAAATRRMSAASDVEAGVVVDSRHIDIKAASPGGTAAPRR